MKYKLKTYKTDEIITMQDDKDMLNEVIEDYCEDSIIIDIFYEVASESVSYYYDDLFEVGKTLFMKTDHTKESLTMGIEDLAQILAESWSSYNLEQIFNNESELIYNYAINYLNELDDDTEVDITELEVRLENEIDTNNTFDDIIEIVDLLRQGL